MPTRTCAKSCMDGHVILVLSPGRHDTVLRRNSFSQHGLGPFCLDGKRNERIKGSMLTESVGTKAQWRSGGEVCDLPESHTTPTTMNTKTRVLAFTTAWERLGYFTALFPKNLSIGTSNIFKFEGAVTSAILQLCSSQSAHPVKCVS